ncbi:methyltransferase domain-containing protein [Candidatus Woesearchaeota archaeon]|nr:methyltransferase domain-containing protein [Candidatus Woesearchaeota archaeon]
MGNKSFFLQVSREHYFSQKYNSLDRFQSYFYQIDSIIQTKPKKILEIGIGSGIVSTYLKSIGFYVKTCDIDHALNPDIVGDIRDLPFSDYSFDTVVSFEVLEHIPFSDVPSALKELARVTKRFVIVSIPFSTVFFALLLRWSLPFTSRTISCLFKIPRVFNIIKFDGIKNKEHYWEMGTRGYSYKKISTAIKKSFNIRREFYSPTNPNHHFFVLEKKM